MTPILPHFINYHKAEAEMMSVEERIATANHYTIEAQKAWCNVLLYWPHRNNGQVTVPRCGASA